MILVGICFWVTVCKTVRPILLDRCPVCPVLFVMLVHCGQTVGWITMKLGVQVGLGPGQMVLDGDSPPRPPDGHSPQFSAHICCGQMAEWMKMPLRQVDLGPGHIVLDGDPTPLPHNFWPMSVVAKRLDG